MGEAFFMTCLTHLLLLSLLDLNQGPFRLGGSGARSNLPL
jgi:hypothetical protein